MAVVGLVEDILPPFGKAFGVLHICQRFTADATGIDEDAGFGEHLVQFR